MIEQIPINEILEQGTLVEKNIKYCGRTCFCAGAKYCNKHFRVKETFEFEGRIYSSVEECDFYERNWLE